MILTGLIIIVIFLSLFLWRQLIRQRVVNVNAFVITRNDSIASIEMKSRMPFTYWLYRRAFIWWNIDEITLSKYRLLHHEHLRSYGNVLGYRLWQTLQIKSVTSFHCSAIRIIRCFLWLCRDDQDIYARNQFIEHANTIVSWRYEIIFRNIVSRFKIISPNRKSIK